MSVKYGNTILPWVIAGITEGISRQSVADAVYNVCGFDYYTDRMTWNCNEEGCHNLPVKDNIFCFLHLPWPESVKYR